MLQNSELEESRDVEIGRSSSAHGIPVKTPSPRKLLSLDNENTATINDLLSHSESAHSFQMQNFDASVASKQLATGVLQLFEPPLKKVRNQLKELIGKQNKIYIDLSAEKFKLDNADVAKVQEMMNSVKVYREKLSKIKKQMFNIYHRTKTLKKRAEHVQACKQRELQRKIQKQQFEESLIGQQQHETQ